MKRHQLVRVFPAAWNALIDSRADLAGEFLLRDWARNGWPLIVRRPLPGERDGWPLGLPLPPSLGKRRVAITLQQEDVASVAPLPELADAISSAPLAWHASLQRLVALAKKYEVQARVFGSLAWQVLTGLNYLGPASDLDIVWTLPPPDRTDDFLADLAQADADAPMRLDGELLREDGAGVNWRELHSGIAEVVLKTAAQVILCPRADFIGATIS